MKNKQSRKESTKKWGHKSTLPYHSTIDIWSTWETRSERIDRPLFRSHFLGSFFSSRRGGAFNRNNNNNNKNKKIKINPRWSIPTQVCSEKKGKELLLHQYYSIDTTGLPSFSSSSSSAINDTPSSIDPSRRQENSTNDGWIIPRTIKERADLYDRRCSNDRCFSVSLDPFWHHQPIGTEEIKKNT